MSSSNTKKKTRYIIVAKDTRQYIRLYKFSLSAKIFFKKSIKECLKSFILKDVFKI